MSDKTWHHEADDNDNDVCNNSGNRTFRDVLHNHLSRRDVLKGSLALAATSFLPAAAVAAGGKARGEGDQGGFRDHRSRLVKFEPVSVAEGTGPWPTISEDYEWDVLIPWGEPLQPDGPEYNWPPTAADQAEQIGIGHDGMWYFPLDDKQENQCRRGGGRKSDDYYGDRMFYNWPKKDSRHGVLAINHEFGRNNHVYGKSGPESLEDVRVSQHAHGVSCVEIQKIDGKWQSVKSDKSRRIHVNTPMAFSGPVADSDLLKTPHGNMPRGTVNNCSSGPTPWGTYLTCEENFNGYFGWTDPNFAPTGLRLEGLERYGFGMGGFGYGWEQFDPRFDLSNPEYTNEENRFGWVVEIDPMDGTQKPVKRTALGRFKHEGATTVIGSGGRAVVYMGDDQRFDYIYKFVSSGDYKRMLKKGKSPLDEGTLYAAKFNDDGSGEWLELSLNNPAVAAKFSSMDEVLTYARLAADAAGATPMDRPEWTTVAHDRWVYCTLTNNSRRTVPDAANPLAPNHDGHIIRWKDSYGFTGTTFRWQIFLIAEDTHGTEESFSDPDGIWADPDGRLFIETDGGQKDGLNNQLLVCDTKTKEIARLFTGVTGDEITGLTLTPDRRTLFINTQHPGNGDPSLTNFPAPQDGVTVPRDATIVITRKDGGIIGS